MEIESNWKYKHIQLQKSVSVTSLTIVQMVSIQWGLSMAIAKVKKNCQKYLCLSIPFILFVRSSAYLSETTTSTTTKKKKKKHNSMKNKIPDLIYWTSYDKYKISYVTPQKILIGYLIYLLNTISDIFM